MIRSFLAFDISDEVKKNLGSLIGTLQSQAKESKWVEPTNFHVTLKFFGSVDEATLLKIMGIIEKSVKEVKPVLFHCVGVGAFPKWEHPKVLWAGLEGATTGLADLQQRLDGEFESLGFEREKRGFTPHLTIARLRFPPKQASWLKTLQGMKGCRFGETLVDHLTLYKSELTKKGPVYTALKVFSFS